MRTLTQSDIENSLTNIILPNSYIFVSIFSYRAFWTKHLKIYSDMLNHKQFNNYFGASRNIRNIKFAIKNNEDIN